MCERDDIVTYKEIVHFFVAKALPAAANLAGANFNVVAEPSENDISSLVALGFERAQCIAALRRSRNDVNEAANFLFQNA